MTKLIKELRYHLNLNYQVKAIAFAKAPARIKRILLVLQTLYLQAVFALIGDAMFGLSGAVSGAALAAVASYLYFWALDRDGQEAMRQVQALIDAKEVEDDTDPSRV